MKKIEMLQKMKEATNSELEKAVINIIIEQGQDDIENYINNVLTYGCVSGAVSALIYYRDTEKFFDAHAEEILEILNNYTDDGVNIEFEINKNNLAWMAFEEICYRISNEIES
ncbi:hypothetical protein [uncultured Clostridium sp.]|uniref:DUF7222 domain-containing protein n=1 Tax=uncultured Clostridium sp. TaxID=59620 RepID=UPI0025DE0CD0|nr:hypothetical protein [uncultured Clostridium sp.]